MDKKLTDSEITIKALKEVLEVMLSEGDLQRISTISHTIDLINRLQAENKNLQERNVILRGLVDTQKAENERFGKIKKMLDMFWETLLKIGMAKRKEKPTLEEFAEALQEIQASAKAEAYKECIEKVKEKSCKLNMCHNDVVVKTDYQISDENLDNLLKELVGDSDAR